MVQVSLVWLQPDVLPILELVKSAEAPGTLMDFLKLGVIKKADAANVSICFATGSGPARLSSRFGSG